MMLHVVVGFLASLPHFVVIVMLAFVQMKTGHLLSLTHVPQHMLNPTQCDTVSDFQIDVLMQ